MGQGGNGDFGGCEVVLGVARIDHLRHHGVGDAGDEIRDVAVASEGRNGADEGLAGGFLALVVVFGFREGLVVGALAGEDASADGGVAGGAAGAAEIGLAGYESLGGLVHAHGPLSKSVSI